MNFRQEAVELMKEIIAVWDQYRDFEAAVTIIEDYITDMDTKYASND